MRIDPERGGKAFVRSCPGFHEGNGEVCTHFALVSMSFVHDFTIEQGLNFKLVNQNFGKKISSVR